MWALATVCGVGAFPVMPATLMCALMVPVALAVLAIGGGAVFFVCSLVVAVLATVVSVLIERSAADEFFSDDPREFVMDEVAGQAVAWCFLGFGAVPWAVVAGFFAFRFFDIFKFGIDWVERLPVGGKVVWDDVLAGVYAGVVVAGVAALA